MLGKKILCPYTEYWRSDDIIGIVPNRILYKKKKKKRVEKKILIISFVSSAK